MVSGLQFVRMYNAINALMRNDSPSCIIIKSDAMYLGIPNSHKSQLTIISIYSSETPSNSASSSL